MELKQLLFSLAQKNGVSGMEDSAVAYVADLLKPYAQEIKVDAMGNLIALIQPPKVGKPHILLDAHIDEIGMIVTSVEENGFLHVANCGGVDRKVLLAQEVTVHAKQDLYGVISSKPPHLGTAEEHTKIPEMDQVLIDTGLNTERAKELISLGDRITMVAHPVALMNGRLSCKAMDDRAGAAAILKAVEQLVGHEYDCGLSVLFSVQEETGTRGAGVGSFDLQPDICIAVDVSFALTSDAPEHKCGKMGEGVMIGIAPTLTGRISKQLMDIAKRKTIPHQLEIMGGETSTNADVIGLSGRGVQTGLCSIPLRYMHTPIESLDLVDVQSVADLLSAYVLEAGETNV